MKLKLNEQGFAVVRDGKPVYVHDDGREEAFDAPTAMKLALGKHFEASPVMAGLKIPHDIVAATFSSSFRIEGGKLVAVDKNGIQMYSGTRHGEIANFDEALAQLVDRYPHKSMIQRDGGASTPAPGQQGRNGPAITRPQFDALPPASRAKFMSEGGRIDDVASGGAPAPVASSGTQTITRPQFDAMGPKERAQHFGNGGKIVD
jgi:hypothetical protein